MQAPHMPSKHRRLSHQEYRNQEAHKHGLYCISFAPALSNTSILICGSLERPCTGTSLKPDHACAHTRRNRIRTPEHLNP